MTVQIHDQVKVVHTMQFTEQQQKFRNAMSQLAAAVNIITTDGIAGRAGFTASAVCSVSDTPPTLLVCLNRNASVYPIFKANQKLCVNTLTADQQTLSQIFGGKTPMYERFMHGQWQELATGCPVLIDALVAFDCRIHQIVSMGSHDVLFCEVEDLRCNTYEQNKGGLMYFNRQYHTLSK